MNETELAKIHDVYNLLTEDEYETVKRIFLEALDREKDIQPKSFSIETHVILGDNETNVLRTLRKMRRVLEEVK